MSRLAQTTMLFVSSICITGGLLRNFGPDEHVLTPVQKILYNGFDKLFEVKRSEIDARLQELRVKEEQAIMKAIAKAQETNSE